MLLGLILFLIHELILLSMLVTVIFKLMDLCISVFLNFCLYDVFLYFIDCCCVGICPESAVYCFSVVDVFLGRFSVVRFYVMILGVFCGVTPSYVLAEPFDP